MREAARIAGAEEELSRAPFLRGVPRGACLRRGRCVRLAGGRSDAENAERDDAYEYRKRCCDPGPTTAAPS